MKDWRYKYPITVDRVVDGDTVDVIIDLGFNMYMKKRVIMSGYDVPDLWRANEEEKVEAENYKNLLENIIFDAKDNLFIETNKDKEGVYGRVIGEIFFVNVFRESESADDDRVVSVNEIMARSVENDKNNKAELNNLFAENFDFDDKISD